MINGLPVSIISDRELKWHLRFLARAKLVAESSKDPSTKVGAIVVDEENRTVSDGYNGFPRGVEDLPERYEDRKTKYAMTVHAELNAILFAQRDLANCRMYVFPLIPCPTCAGAIIQSSIRQVITVAIDPEKAQRWAEAWEIARVMFQEAQVELTILDRGS